MPATVQSLPQVQARKRRRKEKERWKERPVAQDGEKDFGTNSQRVSELQASILLDHGVGEDKNIHLPKKINFVGFMELQLTNISFGLDC